jgi:hypothetical protein
MTIKYLFSCSSFIDTVIQTKDDVTLSHHCTSTIKHLTTNDVGIAISAAIFG